MIKRSGFSERNPDRTGLSEVEFPPVLILGADFFEVFGVHPENEVVGREFDTLKSKIFDR